MIKRENVSKAITLSVDGFFIGAVFQTQIQR
jgi:hypothetical protein